MEAFVLHEAFTLHTWRNCDYAHYDSRDALEKKKKKKKKKKNWIELY